MRLHITFYHSSGNSPLNMNPAAGLIALLLMMCLANTAQAHAAHNQAARTQEFIGPVQAKQEPVSGSREVLLNNADVEVVRLTYPPGAQSGMHTHPHPFRVVYFIKGGTLLLQPADENEPEKQLVVPDGKTLYLPATTHNVINTGGTEVIILETEIKNSALRN